ncbi:unnamed protein product [Callosobruchus maculatus]|uniref:C2H2-type domain-containing protein n=1 Tax=Callosobruchus maculatus TaxID=64391 RepID=A0A653CFC7_CALMS|nr:unnamed protein product [Callosobruchus maculatus]
MELISKFDEKDYFNDLKNEPKDYFEILPDDLKAESKDCLTHDSSSDDESLNGGAIQDAPSESEDFDPVIKSVRKSRRKALVPQKAVQLDITQKLSLENSSESSQDYADSLRFTCIQNLSLDLSFKNSQELDIDDVDFADDLFRDFAGDNIFKDLEEETGEPVDEEAIDNVKEEWRAQWGIKCNMCEQVFPFKVEFDKHYMSSYNLMPVYTCTFCNKSLEKYSTFRSHCYRHITEGRYKCPHCSKAFSLQSLLHVHIIAKHTKSKPFKCDECNRRFVTKPGLRIHMKKHKTETKEDYPCVECGKILHTRGGLTSHMNVHRLGRRFMCDVCGKTFTQKVNMQQHVKQHTGDKPFVCVKCGKSFAEKSHLMRHLSFHTEERPYKCEVCQKMYKTERCLKVHSLTHSTNRPFVCEFCNKGFLSSTKLKQHCNIHTGERPYKCKYCERTFTNYPNWLKHTRRRHRVDHKTGAELNTKPGMKDETSKTPESSDKTTDEIATSTQPETSSEIQETEDNLAKVEELLLQQGLFNFPLLDDKIGFNPPNDFISGK